MDVGNTERPAGPLDSESGAEAIFGLLSDEFPADEADQVEEDRGDEDDVEGEQVDDITYDDVAKEDGDDDDEQVDEEDGEADEDTDDQDDVPQTYQVKVDGEDVEVTLDEALKGYQRQQAFTRKTQALAEERKALEAEAAGVAQKRQEYLDRLGVVEAALQQGVSPEPDWDQLKRDNPEQYAETRLAYQERKDQIAALEAERTRVQKEAQDHFEAERERHLAREQEQLEAAIPEWAADPDVALNEKRNLAEFAQNTYGFTDRDLMSVVDHRVVLLLRDAMKYAELQTRGNRAKGEVREKRRQSPTLKPGTPQSGRKKSKVNPARKRLTQSGSVEDAAAVLFDMI